MQLSTVKISNILSFPYEENLTSVDGIKFHHTEAGVSNILIGPNGSGKSNILKIIASVWKYAITIDYERNDHNKQLIIKPKPHHHLQKFRGQEQYSAHIYMSIFLTSGDISNLIFIQKHHTQINELITQYSPDSPLIPPLYSTDLHTLNKIPLYCTLHHDRRLIFEQHNKDPIIQFVYYYFQHFELLQHCIDLGMHYHRQPRTPLANTFAFITDEYHNIHSPEKSLRLLLKKYKSLTPLEGKERTVIQQFFVDSINTIVRRYTNFSLTIDSQGVHLFDDNGQACQYQSLSLGEQSFLRLIFLIFSHDLQHGLLMIDEPETHLHPQAQKEFLKLLEELVQKQHIQAIIATHAPSLITVNTIHHVFRCTKQQGQTKIYAPQYTQFQSDHSLGQLLKFDAIAKVFFVDTIILVEGETDLYFFSHYLEYLSEQTQREPFIKNYEIIAISGKGGINKRKHFLRKFNTHISYIGDRDNIAEFGIIPHQELQQLHYHHRQIPRASKYGTTVEYIRTHKKRLAHHIDDHIDKLYQSGTYILKQGDLETYLGLESKGFDDTVAFCLHDFNKRLYDPKFTIKRNELETIIRHIFQITSTI